MATAGMSMQLEGVQDAIADLNILGRKIQKTVLQKAVRAGASPYVREVKRRCPVDTRTLKRSLKQKVKTYSGSGTVTSITGAKSQRQPNGRNPAKYLHLVEGGTKPHRIEARRGGSLRVGASRVRAVDHPGARAERFMQRASEAAKNDMQRGFLRKIQTVMPEVWRKQERATG